MTPDIVTRNLQGSSDLTLVAPVKRGLVDLLDTRTYESRLRAVLDTLNTLRKTSREHSLVRPFSDSTDRIRTITDLRMAILDDGRTLMLSVTFDRPWEPYLRIIWRDVGTLLDLIFCNCEGYPVSTVSSFAVYGAWVRQARTNTRFFYRPTDGTFDDLSYLRQVERLQRAVPDGSAPAPDPALAAARVLAADPAETARQTVARHFAASARLGLQAVSVLYRLTDLYRSAEDESILLRAARELLREFQLVTPHLPAAARQRFDAQLAWYAREAPRPQPRQPAAAPLVFRTEKIGAHGIQRGILEGYGDLTHGCVALIGGIDPASAAAFLARVRREIATEGAAAPPDGIHVNVAFTAHGLRRLGLAEADLEGCFPHEFLDGMGRRAGLIGDVRGNHPLRWALPERNWPAPVLDPVTGRAARVQMETVHAALHLYLDDRDRIAFEADPHPRLQARLKALTDDLAPLAVLSVQALQRRHFDLDGKRVARDHFHFVDGLSQPEVVVQEAAEPVPNAAWSNRIGPGELLCGYPNDRGDPPRRHPLTDDGSFLVVRKLRQHVPALDAALDAALAQPDLPAGMTAPDLKSRLMGRTVDGDPLASPGSGNAFDYGGDPFGAKCPLEAHIRRANPRTPSDHHGQATVPRIVRRGMSYGPRIDETADPQAERGLVFMAYNASIAEQFEVVQRWLSGGNSTGVLSDHSDPLLGVPRLDEERSFRFHDGKRVHRVRLDAADDAESRPFVQLEWGAYFFAPSRPALEWLERQAGGAVAASGPAESVLMRGAALIAALEARQKSGERAEPLRHEWKVLLEDAQSRACGDTEAVWTAIRQRPGGVLRTPYGVLVASRDAVDRVLDNADGAFSVAGYGPRLQASIGSMFLGLDASDPEYARQSSATNATLLGLSRSTAFAEARRLTGALLAALIEQSRGTAQPASTWEATLDVREIADHTLAGLCDLWFFGPSGGAPHLERGGWRWDRADEAPPLYPGHFTAPSRYLFQPHPGATAEAEGQRRGASLLRAMRGFVAARSEPQAPPLGPIARTIFDDPALAGGDLRARTLLGTLIGFLPTVDGSFRSVMNEWLGGAVERLTLCERLPTWTLWDLQNAYIAGGPPADVAAAYARAELTLLAPLLRTMQLRPVPEVVWRTATVPVQLGAVAVEPNERVVVGLVSACHQALVADRTDVCPVFGGDRRSAPERPHACPAAEAAVGVLLGMVAGLLEAGPVGPTPAPLTVGLRGPMPTKSDRQPTNPAASTAA